jgi:D-alanine-D-alanine ligase
MDELMCCRIGITSVDFTSYGSKKGKVEMNIVLTYDPRWGYTPESQSPNWASLDTVDYVVELLEDCGCRVILCSADNNLETSLQQILSKHPRSIVFWLNEFMPTDSGREIFTVNVVEKVGLKHTGPSSEALGKGLDKEVTKNVFRKLGLPTPESVVVYPGDYSPINQCTYWDGNVIIKPLMQGCSKGIDEHSVIYKDEVKAIRDKVDQIHHIFNEPAFVERYIGGKDAKEFTIPMLISHDGEISNLPITEIDFSQIPATQGKFRYLTQEFKQANRAEYKLANKPFLKIPADLPPQSVKKIQSDVKKIANVMRCRDLARIDIRADSTGWFYIEVSVNPGKNKSSYLIMSASSLGLNYTELIAFIPYQAILKYGLKPPRKLEDLTKPVMELFETSLAVERAEII